MWAKAPQQEFNVSLSVLCHGATAHRVSRSSAFVILSGGHIDAHGFEIRRRALCNYLR